MRVVSGANVSLESARSLSLVTVTDGCIRGKIATSTVGSIQKVGQKAWHPEESNLVIRAPRLSASGRFGRNVGSKHGAKPSESHIFHATQPISDLKTRAASPRRELSNGVFFSPKGAVKGS